jgi:hypothetical protein
MDRSRLESLVWKFTHKDFKSVVDGKRSVLVNGPQGATLTPLARLSDEELHGLRGHRMAGKLPGTAGNADSWNLRTGMPPGTMKG